jgi:hypothetical protein
MTDDDDLSSRLPHQGAVAIHGIGIAVTGCEFLKAKIDAVPESVGCKNMASGIEHLGACAKADIAAVFEALTDFAAFIPAQVPVLFGQGLDADGKIRSFETPDGLKHGQSFDE